MRTHTGERPFVCGFDGCGKAFADSRNFDKHQRVHTGERPYICDSEGCGKAFTLSGHLDTHKRMHTGERPYACGIDGCGKVFAKSDNLTVHMRAHTGQRPYVCGFDGCGKAFAQITNLDAHRRIHSGERPYKCSWLGCKHTCTQSSHLDAHKRTHTGAKPFACTEDGCDYRSTVGCHLKAHTRRWHTLEGLQRQKRSEERLARALTAAGIAYVREHHVDTTCIRARGSRRIDFLATHHAADGSGRGVVIAVENDERQHDTEDADCHCKRMAEVAEALALGGNTLPVAFVRFNPHGFSKDGVTCRTMYVDRVKALVAVINGLKARVDAADAESLPPLSIRYLFYNTDADGRPCLLKDPLYSPDLVPCVVL